MSTVWKPRIYLSGADPEILKGGAPIIKVIIKCERGVVHQQGFRYACVLHTLNSFSNKNIL